MRRIVILGCSGSGKSTLARALGERLNLPVVHLDVLFWQPGWKEPEPQAFIERVKTAIAGDAWITDGVFAGRTFDLRLPRADTVIFIHQPRWLCLCRVLWRWLSWQGRPRPDLAPGCPENLDWPFLMWVWNFERKFRPGIEARLATYDVPVIDLNGDKAVAAFLASVSA